ncbi:hypothetical protein BGZ94_006445 [Podila epigama]|nr:hypothetical protein BGZ94_006445 [Podila epigama]
MVPYRSHASRLAPELILHILSFLDYTDHPARLLPIVTLCKHWAGAALVALYHQPVLNVAQCALLVKTLLLKDRYEGKILWDPSSTPSQQQLGTEYTTMAIDYMSLIKKSCRIVGTIAPTKQDLIQLWDLQFILWSSPNFKKESVSEPPSPTLSHSRSHSPSSSSPQSPTPPPSEPGKDSPRSTTPLSNKVIMPRRKKKQPSPGPCVLLLDQPLVMTDTTEYILNEVGALQLRQLHAQWLLRTPLLRIVEDNISTLESLSLTKSPMRAPSLEELALALGGEGAESSGAATTQDASSQRLRVLRLEDCAGLTREVLSAFARSCSSSLQTLDIRHSNRLQVLGDQAVFPLDGPGNWDPETFAATSAHLTVDHPSLGVDEQCTQCGIKGTHTADPTQHQATLDNSAQEDVEIHINNLNIAEAVMPASSSTPAHEESTQNEATPPPQGLVAVDQAQTNRIDIALVDFSERCTQLRNLCLHRITWLSDMVLAGFCPAVKDGVHRGLRSIEIMDSHYGSSVTIEGVLDMCGPLLESLILDRRSCWRVRPKPDIERAIGPLCLECHKRDVHQRTIEENRTTGDRILQGLLLKDQASTIDQQFRRLHTIVLHEHWVTVAVLKVVMQRWASTLRTLDLKMCKCSNQELLDALIPLKRCSSTPVSTHIPSQLNRISLTLALTPGETTEELNMMARHLFESHVNLQTFNVNGRTWGKVHGSLARAGKVKSQTPKVAKQEKKKKLTGRAKKRDTYKRRFVNVTNAPGGKRRMNVNPESTKN